METKHAIELAGSPAALAKMLGISAAAVSQWGQTIPKARVWQLKVIRPEWFRTDGKRIVVTEAH